MADFNQSQGWNGTCAPFMYIRDCSPTARTAYQNTSRFWLAANSVSLLVLIVSIIRRSRILKERFNTLKLAVILFTLYPPFHIVFDALRVNDINEGGWPIHIIAFLWIGGWMPLITGMLLLVVTWVSFSSKNLLARPALTGHPMLFWGLEIPFLVGGIVGSFVCGVNYWYYFISMRVAIASWSAFFLILGFFAAYYGQQTLFRLHKTQDSFNYRQQLRILIMTVGMFIVCGIVMGFQAFFMERIDAFYQMFILVTALYRVCGWVILVGSAVYVWVSTNHHITHSTRGSRSERSARRSHATRSRDSRDSRESRTSTEKSSNARGAKAPQNDYDDKSDVTSEIEEESEHEDSGDDSEIEMPVEDSNDSSASLLEPYGNDAALPASQTTEDTTSSTSSS